MYWHQPLIECRWPTGPDPFDQLLGDQYLLFYDPEFDFRGLKTNQRLADLCAWANQGLDAGISAFSADARNHYDIANLVKLNMWAADIRQQGIVKPWLILDWGDGTREAGTGDSRLRLCEIMPEIQSVRAFVSTHQDRTHLYHDLESVRDLQRFGELCLAEPDQHFLFRTTTVDAPFGIYWYEYDSSLTRRVTPGESWCVAVFDAYHRSCPATITPAWFLDPVDWYDYADTVQ